MVQGIGNGYGYSPAAVPQRQATFMGQQYQQAQPQPQKKKSFLGGVVKLALLVGSVALAIKSFRGRKHLINLAQKGGALPTTIKWNKATKGLEFKNFTKSNLSEYGKVFGEFIKRNADPRNWKTTNKLANFYNKKFNKNLIVKTRRNPKVSGEEKLSSEIIKDAAKATMNNKKQNPFQVGPELQKVFNQTAEDTAKKAGVA